MRGSKFITAAAFVFIGFCVAGEAQAGEVVTYSGCLRCEEATGSTGARRDKCVQVGDNEYGQGITCKETYSGFGSDRTCEVSGGQCYNIVATPGTGGGRAPDGGTG